MKQSNSKKNDIIVKRENCQNDLKKLLFSSHFFAIMIFVQLANIDFIS